MPLRDHFHAPLKTARHWGSLDAMWITAIAERLNERLPQRYFAEAQVHAGASIEIDVGTFRDDGHDADSRNGQPGAPAAHRDGGTAMAGETSADRRRRWFGPRWIRLGLRTG